MRPPKQQCSLRVEQLIGRILVAGEQARILAGRMRGRKRMGLATLVEFDAGAAGAHHCSGLAEEVPMNEFVAVILICMNSVAADQCDERTAADVMSTVVQNEL